MSREDLVNHILELSTDEVDMHLLEVIAKESYEQLVERLANIASWYKEEYEGKKSENIK